MKRIGLSKFPCSGSSRLIREETFVKDLVHFTSVKKLKLGAELRQSQLQYYAERLIHQPANSVHILCFVTQGYSSHTSAPKNLINRTNRDRQMRVVVVSTLLAAIHQASRVA